MLENVQIQVPDPTATEGSRSEPAECTMVVDLTNSSRYYRRESFEESGIYHVKIPNRGRGEVPAPQAVNDFVFEVQSYLHRKPNGYILVHCTHGFNRTGYMIVSHMMRMLSDETTTVEKSLAMFAACRPPGIYKTFYVKSLFHYYHSSLPKDYPMPTLPEWKITASPDDEDGDGMDELESGAIGIGIEHDDPFGEMVCVGEANWVRSILAQYVLGRGENLIFPGSQPVSLARSNLRMLKERRYWVTWKADGTRYLMLLHRAGTYLIDRSNKVTRVQMRWPTPLKKNLPGHPLPRAPIGPLHAGTILDGEMVVDVNPETKERTRRFLAYDLVAINGSNVRDCPWWERWAAIEHFVEFPRRKEASEIQKGTWKMRYNYNVEPFRFRRKAFFDLTAADKLIHEFIPKQVTHEADGLIFQPCDDAYVPLTCEELLKWKFAHMNSVDFKVRLEEATHMVVLQLLQPRGARQATLEDLQGATVMFPQGEDAAAYNDRIIECAWDKEKKSWVFMRERRDKTLPNAKPVYEKVWKSIEDNIQEEELLQDIEKAKGSEVYMRKHAGGGEQNGSIEQCIRNKMLEWSML